MCVGRIFKHKRQEKSWGMLWSGYKQMKGQPRAQHSAVMSTHPFPFTDSQEVITWVGLSSFLLSSTILFPFSDVPET